MQVVRTSGFDRLAKKLVSKKLLTEDEITSALENPNEPSCRLKNVQRLSGYREIRIATRFRAVALVEDSTWNWEWIGLRRDFDRWVNSKS